MNIESLTGNWNYPTSMRFGCGRIRELPDACGELGIRRPLLVTDPGLAALPMTEQTVAICDSAGLPTTVFSDIKPNPVGANVEDGVLAYRDAGCDGVIAYGGGSALDVGKAVALMAGQTRPLWDFEDIGDWYTRVDEAGMAPVVAVPTTSGTGSEVGRASVIIDEQAGNKKIIFHPGMLPGRVVADPELTVGLPRGLTAAVGMDALSHNLEALCSPLCHPMADGIAMEGIRLVHTALQQAVADGSNLVARSRMMAASTMGATAFQKGLGAMHALSHPIGAELDAHHGLCNAIVMPYVLVFNRSAIETKMVALARLLDLPNASFDAVLHWILEMRQAIGIAETTKALGMTESLCDKLAPKAAVDPSAATNPIELDTGNLRSLYRRSLHGDLS